MFDILRIRELLPGVVRSVTTEVDLYDDLMQEAVVHLVKIHEKRPGQTVSWYLKSCKYYLLNYLDSGRSIDAYRRRGLKTQLDDESEDTCPQAEVLARNGHIRSEACARELFARLYERLNPMGRALLILLADGSGVREAARELGVSHPTAIERRRQIAAIATRLGFRPYQA